MATLRDIAKKAGVSTAAVSMALNHKKGVSDETKSRILQIALELGYVLDHTPHAVKHTASKTVILFLSAVDYEYYNSSFYFDIIKHIRIGLDSKLQINIQMSTLSHDEAVLHQLMSTHDVMAFVFIGTRLSPDRIWKIIGNTPAIFFNKPYILGQNSYSVSFDNQRATYMLTRYLAKLGHSDIAYVGNVPGSVPANNRMVGYRSALEEEGLSGHKTKIIESEYLPRCGYDAVKNLILTNEPLPSAMICGNDLIAMGAMQALLDFGFSVPNDVSIAGIDNLHFTSMLQVPLTTIHVNCEKIGSAVARLLHQIAEGKEGERHIMVGVTLVERASTGRYNSQRRCLRSDPVYNSEHGNQS